jgi:hypothetical protein
VVGPDDVADVYDVIGLLSTASGEATFILWDGGRLRATWEGGFAPPPNLPRANSEAELASCAGCWLAETLGGGLSRVRVSVSPSAGPARLSAAGASAGRAAGRAPAAASEVIAGGLGLRGELARRLRWDLYLVE